MAGLEKAAARATEYFDKGGAIAENLTETAAANKDGNE